MDVTERKITEDFRITWPLDYGLTGLAIGLMFVAAATRNDLEAWLFFAGVTGFILVFRRICTRSALRDLAESGWKLTDAGLQRVYASGPVETIRWEQIRHMKWVRCVGLLVRWEESKAEHRRRRVAFRDEFRRDWVYRQYRATLYVHKDEAGELMSVAEEKTGLSCEDR